jgi:hypothetical protein
MHDGGNVDVGAPVRWAIPRASKVLGVRLTHTYILTRHNNDEAVARILKHRSAKKKKIKVVVRTDRENPIATPKRVHVQIS